MITLSLLAVSCDGDSLSGTYTPEECMDNTVEMICERAKCKDFNKKMLNPTYEQIQIIDAVAEELELPYKAVYEIEFEEQDPFIEQNVENRGLGYTIPKRILADSRYQA